MTPKDIPPVPLIIDRIARTLGNRIAVTVVIKSIPDVIIK
jgi:hypothetical protein